MQRPPELAAPFPQPSVTVPILRDAASEVEDLSCPDTCRKAGVRVTCASCLGAGLHSVLRATPQWAP